MEQDFRSGFGGAIRFWIPFRCVRNNLAWKDPVVAEGPTRADRLLPFVALLLYHEPSPVADFVPAAALDRLHPSGTAPEAISAQQDDWPSWRLATELPLESGCMSALAEVFFHGRTPTPDEEATLPGDVVDAFASDGAVDF